MYQIYSLGTGGEFNYGDSQILFHKSMDLVNILSNKESNRNQVSKNHYNIKLNSTVKLGRHKVGDNYPVYVIAEAGLNHNGDINKAFELVEVASNCKADYIKFQTFKAHLFFLGHLI